MNESDGFSKRYLLFKEINIQDFFACQVPRWFEGLVLSRGAWDGLSRCYIDGK